MEMGNKFQCIALDMDGTVLDDEKKILPETEQAIHDALKAKKEVVFCTGRAYVEMKSILENFPDMHYLCGESGALLYDLRRKKAISRKTIDLESVRKIWEAIRDRDVLFLTAWQGRDFMNRSNLNNLKHYQIDVYQGMFDDVIEHEDSPIEKLLELGECPERIILFHTSPEEREITVKRLRDAGCEAALAYSEISCLECSPKGINKAEGLKLLAKEMSISLEQIIMVGDSYNDLEALKEAGLGIAMGNARPDIKAVCSVMVADNNHNGCAEAIRRFLI